MTTPADRDNPRDLDLRYEDFVVAYEEALQDGSSVPEFDDTTVPPELLPRLREVQDCLDLLAEGRRTGELAEALALCRLRTDQDGADDSFPPFEQIGVFEIRRELGRGGYGVVFLAFDPRLKRLVALKVPRPEALVTPELRRRFLREAEAAGGLAHPNLVAVHEVGEDGPLCYIASSYCEGPTLATWLAAQTDPAPCNDAAATIAALADGVDYAHRHGVLHRDIKPSNVLLDPLPGAAKSKAFSNRPLSAFNPCLTDFGLAKLLERDDGETRSGMLLGTPAYMAPCQANGRVRDVCAATDVYALGVALYELLTGRPPFRGANDPDTLRQVCLDDPLRPGRLRRGLSRDLEAICLKCLAKSPTDRYTSAADLARDLRRYLTGEPTLARPTNPAERFVKWGRRHPAVASLSAIVLLGSIVLAGGGWWQSAQLRRALEETRAYADESRARVLENQQFLYVASVNLAERALATGNIQQAQDQLARGVPQAGDPDLRGFAWHHLWRQLHEEELTLSGHTGDVYCVRYASNGHWLATAGKDRTARVWDVASGKCIHVLTGHTDEVNSVAFSPDCSRLASACDDGNVRIWDLAAPTLQRTFVAHATGVGDVAFAPDGGCLATCGRDKTAILWDTSTWGQLAVLEGHQDEVNALAFSPNGATLATVSDDRTVRLWDVATGNLTKNITAHAASVNALAFSADGQRLATAGQSDRAVKVWDVLTGNQVTESAGHFDWIYAVQFCRDDSQLAIATKAGELKLVDIATGDVVRSIHGHANRIWSLSVSSNGRHLADASDDGTAKIWDLLGGASHEVLPNDKQGWDCPHLTCDGRICISTGPDHRITVRDVATRKIRWQAERDFEITGDFNGDGHIDHGYVQGCSWHLQISPGRGADDVFTEKIVQLGAPNDIPIVGDWDGDGRDDIGVYRPSEGTWYLDLDGQGVLGERCVKFGLTEHGPNLGYPHQIPVVGRWLNESCDQIGLASYRNGEWFFHLLHGDSTHSEYSVRQGDEYSVPISGAWTSSSGDDVALLDGDALWIDIAKSGELPEFVIDQQGRGQSRKVRACNVPERDHVNVAKHPPIYPELIDAAKDRALAAFGRRKRDFLASSHEVLATSEDHDSRVKIWDVQSGRRLAVLRCGNDNIAALAFGNEGRTLAVGTDAGELMFWDIKKFSLTGKIRVHKSGVFRLVFAPHGRWLVTSGDEGEIKLWDPVGGSQIAVFREDARYDIHDLAVSPDATLIAAAGANRAITLWNPLTGQLVARLTGHTDHVTSVAFSPDGTTLASGSLDKSVRLWNVHTKQELYALQNRMGPVLEVAFTPQGQELVADAVEGGHVLHFWSAATAVPSLKVEPTRIGPETQH